MVPVLVKVVKFVSASKLDRFHVPVPVPVMVPLLLPPSVKVNVPVLTVRVALLAMDFAVMLFVAAASVPLEIVKAPLVTSAPPKV